ncbi:hypothetical protein ADUPG1_000341 [Aduncisulcus paluster]|uniref:Uncharacterized protein n=1 Tax=Aduncisulcus paluster TaxID=2918883 RepID=A0ABQ5KAS4_9EUKA|nr:hypothetical protein ADUPG1_000341 [Aduncisulcus paluster]
MKQSKSLLERSRTMASRAQYPSIRTQSRHKEFSSVDDHSHSHSIDILAAEIARLAEGQREIKESLLLRGEASEVHAVFAQQTKDAISEIRRGLEAITTELSSVTNHMSDLHTTIDAMRSSFSKGLADRKEETCILASELEVLSQRQDVISRRTKDRGVSMTALSQLEKHIHVIRDDIHKTNKHIKSLRDTSMRLDEEVDSLRGDVGRIEKLEKKNSNRSMVIEKKAAYAHETCQRIEAELRFSATRKFK